MRAHQSELLSGSVAKSNEFLFIVFLAYNCWRIIITAVIAYLLGSVNTAVIVTKIVTGGKKDIREMGSGNAGFTNVLRSVGKVPAIFTIVCDALKCVVAVIIGWMIFSTIPADSQILSNEFGNCGKYIAGIFLQYSDIRILFISTLKAVRVL